jgi:hypothetical protein
MNLGIENIHLSREDWPEVLTPDLRHELLLGKLARARHTLEQRQKCGRSRLLAELETNFVNEQLNQKQSA